LENDLLQKLGSKAITKKELVQAVEANFGLLPMILEGVVSPKATIRYGCGSILIELSEKHPSELYPYLDRFIALLDSKHRISVWNALSIVANLTSVDIDRKFEKNFNKYYGFLNSEYMVTVANVVGNSEKIVSNKPQLADKIMTELLKVQNLQSTPHISNECKLVIAQHTIRTFNTLIEYTQNRKPLIDFAQKHKNSTRASLRKEAQNFLRKWE
jgi:hypothetical protein